MSSRQNDGPGRPGNAKPFTVSLSKKEHHHHKPPFKSQLPPPSRSSGGFSKNKQSNRNLYHRDFSDEEEEEEGEPVHQEVVGFDNTAGGAISKTAASEAKAPLVIKVASKNNWRDRPGVNRKGKNLLPQEVQAAQAAAAGAGAGAGAAVVETEGPSISYGLSLAPSREDGIDDVAEEGKDADMPDAVESSTTPQKPEPLGQDELALQALISESQGNNDRKRPDLVIESSSKGEGRYDETSSFRTDVATRPDQASLEDYNAVPVEEFGAALLRGMGWKEGQSIGRGRYDGSNTAAAAKATVPERRPGFLGIGAKDISGGKGAETEIGAWGKSAMRKGSRQNGDDSGNTKGVYMPIVMKNKSTGEHLTEEEFKTRQLDAKSHAASTTNGRDRHRRYDDEGESRDRRRERSKDPSSRRNRDRSRSSGAYDRRSHRYEDDRERENRRYRDRSDRDRSDRDYKDRSSRTDDYKSSRRERDSNRDDDRDRDRDRHYRSGRDRRDGDSGRDRDRYKDSSRRR